jgi:hypothetical protein
MTNIWKRGSIARNPYHETAFKALGLTPEVTSRAAIASRVEERLRAVRRVPGFYALGERDLTEADVLEARRILFDPTRRILEELLEHKREAPELEELERFRKRLEMPPPVPAAPPNVVFLRRAVQALARACLNDRQLVEVPPHPVDPDPIPPFGRPEADDPSRE